MLSVIASRNAGTVVDDAMSSAMVSAALSPAGIETGEANVRSISVPEDSIEDLRRTTSAPLLTTTWLTMEEGTIPAPVPFSTCTRSPRRRTGDDSGPPGLLKMSVIAATSVCPPLTDAGKDEVAVKSRLWVLVNTWCVFEEVGRELRGAPLGEPVPPALPVSRTSPAPAAV